MDVEILTTGEVARLLGIPRARLDYAIERGHVPQPRKTLMGARRFYIQEDVAKIRAVLKPDKNKKAGGGS